MALQRASDGQTFFQRFQPIIMTSSRAVLPLTIPQHGEVAEERFNDLSNKQSTGKYRRKLMVISDDSTPMLLKIATQTFCRPLWVWLLMMQVWVPEGSAEEKKHSRWQKHSLGILTPSLPQPVKFSGWNVHTYTPEHSIFDGPVTDILLILCILIEIFSRAHANGQKKQRKKEEAIISDSALLLVIFQETARQAWQWKG